MPEDWNEKMALARARVFAPGPLVAGTKLVSGPVTYRFHPLGTGPQPTLVVDEYWKCPHGSHVLSERRYPDIDPPARFLDCDVCNITWEVGYPLCEGQELPWLNGWPRMDLRTVLMGTGTHCVGCGRLTGVVTAVIPEDWVPPPEPRWPFTEDACPVCTERPCPTCESRPTGKPLGLDPRRLP